MRTLCQPVDWRKRKRKTYGKRPMPLFIVGAHSLGKMFKHSEVFININLKVRDENFWTNYKLMALHFVKEMIKRMGASQDHAPASSQTWRI